MTPVTITVYRRGHSIGETVQKLYPTLPNDEVGLSPYRARRLAAQLTAAADKLDPPPSIIRGRTPYGWDRSRGWVVNLREAEGLDIMAECYLSGMSLSAIADRLNRLEYPMKGGGPWKFNSVHSTLNSLIRRGGLDPADRQLLSPDDPLPLSG
jgi:hypothetical protein